MRKILVLGHVDHGKTTFIRALNSVLYYRFGIGNEADLIPGRTVSATKSASFAIGGENYQYFDYPGFADYVDMFEAGTEKFDAALMVCSAMDGPMPETIALARMAKENGIEKLALYISNTDCVDDEEMREIVTCEVEEALADEGYAAPIPVVQGSSVHALEFPKEEYGDRIVDTINAVAGLF